MAVSRRWSGCLSALAVLLLATGCGDNRHQQVVAYLNDVNAVQKDAAPELERANNLYLRYTRGEVDATAMETGLTRAQRAVTSLRLRLARITPPADARRLRRLILAYYDRGAGLARETAQLGRYLPAAEAALKPLERVSRTLRRRLDAARRPAQQAAALAAYADALGKVVTALRGLDPPPVLLPAHRTQVERLTLARVLANRLRQAIARRDAGAVTRLVARVQRVGAADDAPTLSRQALHAYNLRHSRLTAAAADVEREWRRLETSLR